MEKGLASLLAILLLGGALTACSGSTESTQPVTQSETNETAMQTEGEPATQAGPEDNPEAEPEGPAPVTLLVAAAASLEYSFTTELIPLFQQRYPWITVEGTYDSSGKLQTQIEEGLPADVFMPAANAQMDSLVGQGLVNEGDAVPLLENEIVLIVPAGSDGDITDFTDLEGVENVALGDPESVPAGQYAREALTSLGIYGTVATTASLGTNVTEVLNWVAEGSAPAGIVYATDAATTENVEVVASAPEGSLETKVIYPVAVLAGSENSEAAGLFVEFLQSPEAIAIFEAYGFKPNL